MFRALLVVCLALVSITAASAASFDCNKAATPVEKMICQSGALSGLDDQMVQIYGLRLAKSDNPSALRTAQLTWLRNRRNKCTDDACLIAAYNERLLALGVQPQINTTPAQSGDIVPAPLTPTVAAMDSPPSPNFQQGQADRTSWEAWFGSQTSDYYAGAAYWASHRSLPNPGSCSARPPSTSATWTAGCYAAQQRLAAADVRRKSEPDYRLGWNNAPPVVSSLAPANVGEIAASPTTLAPASQGRRSLGADYEDSRDLVVKIELARLPENRIEASTNLPDGTQLQASLQPPLATCRPNCGYVWEANLTVAHGHFIIGPFRSDLIAGTYTLEITSPLAALQPESVRALIGDNGEHLKGQFTKAELVPGVGPTVHLNASIEMIASSAQPSGPPASPGPAQPPLNQTSQTGHEWMRSAPAFCQSRPYSSLTPEEMASCDEAAFRYLSKNWQNVTASNGQVYEIAMDTIYDNLPPNVDPAATLRAATVVVYESKGKLFNARNVQQFYFDCRDHFQTFQQGWSPVTYAPPLSVAAKIASIACEKSPPRAIAAAQAAPPETKSYDPIPEGWNIKIALPGTLSVGAEYCTQSGKCKYVGDDIAGFRIGQTPVGGIQGCQSLPDAEPCLKARIPVEVLAKSPAGSVIVRLNGQNYAVSGLQWYKREPDGSYIGGPVSVIYQGASVPLQLYRPGSDQMKH
jgi:uncharacterized protein